MRNLILTVLRNTKYFKMMLVMVTGAWLMVPNAVAGDGDATQGTLEALFHGTHSYTSFPHHNQTVVGGALKGSVVILQSSGGPFVQNKYSSVQCLVSSRVSHLEENSMSLEAPCTMVSDSGQLYVKLRRDHGDTAIEGGGDGYGDILAGTGDFAGITGSCTYKATYLPDNQASTRLNCSWERAAPAEEPVRLR